jgi:plastocyanin
MRYSSLSILGLALGAGSLLAACSSSDTTTAPSNPGGVPANTFQVGDPGASNPNVFISNNAANPSSLTVPVGTTVTWTWPSGVFDHDVTPRPSSGNMPSGSGSPQNGPATYTFTFNTAGTFGFYCTVHGTPQGSGMAGQVIVQ